MNQTELEALSKRAAECLPDDCKHVCTPEGYTVEGGRMLHDSNGACAQIMVRVLWPQDIGIEGSDRGAYAVKWAAYEDELLVPSVFFEDQMLAFRVAVLRALIALKGG